jgi:hypothetical protein
MIAVAGMFPLALAQTAAAEVQAPPAFYFAEGTVRPGFVEYLLLQNPGTKAANVSIAFQGADDNNNPVAVPAKTLVLPPASRHTIQVNDFVAAGGVATPLNISAKVTADRPIVAERALYFASDPSLGSVVDGGNAVIGAQAPARQWSFAEGTVRPGFVEYLTIQNPSSTPATAVLSFQGADDTNNPVVVPDQSVALAPQSRHTVRVNDLLTGAGVATPINISVKVTSDQLIVAERPLYFSSDPGVGTVVDGGHDVLGLPGDPSTCIASDNGRSGPGHFRFAANPCENASASVLHLPIYQGTSHGRTVWYVVTDSSDQADATSRGVNFAPKLANAVGTGGIQTVTVNNGVIDFPATVTFGGQRVLVPGPAGFPPNQAEPPSIGEPGYSPLIQLPNGIVLNASHVANDTGQADKVILLDTTNKTVLYQETEGRYEDKAVHYASFDGSTKVAAALEDVTWAPALDNLPSPGAEGLPGEVTPGEITPSVREELDAFVNGPTGVTNPQRQGLNSAILDGLDPHNILHEVPALANHADVGDAHYSPMWDPHLAEWTQAAIADGSRVELKTPDEIRGRVADGLITGPGGAPFGASGFVVNCPLMSIDIP